LKKVIVPFLVLFGAPIVIRRPGICLLRYAPGLTLGTKLSLRRLL